MMSQVDELDAETVDLLTRAQAAGIDVDAVIREKLSEIDSTPENLDELMAWDGDDL